MKKLFLFIFILLCEFLTLDCEAQTLATTDNGKRVKLYSNGTWEYIENEKSQVNTSVIYANGKKMISGGKILIAHDAASGLETYISIVKDGGNTSIVFWQESDDETMNFYNELWTGTTTIFLENGETVKLIDRNEKGQNKLNSSGKTIYQRYIVYNLTTSECEKLKILSLLQIGYKTTSYFETGTTYLEVTENPDAVQTQLSVLNK